MSSVRARLPAPNKKDIFMIKKILSLFKSKPDPSIVKQAIRMNELIQEGKIQDKDLPLLVREGLDPQVVEYWKNNLK